MEKNGWIRIRKKGMRIHCPGDTVGTELKIPSYVMASSLSTSCSPPTIVTTGATGGYGAVPVP